MANELKNYRRTLAREGWEIIPGRKHVKCYHPKGGMIVMAATASDHRAILNAKGDVQRLKLKHGEKQ